MLYAFLSPVSVILSAAIIRLDSSSSPALLRHSLFSRLQRLMVASNYDEPLIARR